MNIINLSENTIISKVIYIKHYSNYLFSFKIIRPNTFKFKSGEFVMIGLYINNKPIFRAYSLCNATWEHELEFYSIKVTNGPFTSILQKISINDKIILKQKTTGTLVLNALKPGKRLFLLCTGTGIAPFISILKEPETYDQFKEIFIILTCRFFSELVYIFDTINNINKNKILKQIIHKKIRIYTTITRENYIFKGRLTKLIQIGLINLDLKLNTFNKKFDRFMICGSNNMIIDTSNILKKLGFQEGANNNPKDFVYEKSFVN